MSTFRNHLPLTKASQAQEKESEGHLPPPTSNQYHGETSLQVKGDGQSPVPLRPLLVAKLSHQGTQTCDLGSSSEVKLTVFLVPLQATLLGLVALNKAYPEVLAPGGTARVTPTSPWPSPLPWPWRALGWASPTGAKDSETLLLEALRSPELRGLEAGTAVDLLDVFLDLESRGEELAAAIAVGNPGAPLPRRAAELRDALNQGSRGLALRLWPKLQVVVTLDAGGQAEAVAALGALWCQGLAFFSPAYSASGGQLDTGTVRWGQG
jgi:hypothetical protein